MLQDVSSHGTKGEDYLEKVLVVGFWEAGGPLNIAPDPREQLHVGGRGCKWPGHADPPLGKPGRSSHLQWPRVSETSQAAHVRRSTCEQGHRTPFPAPRQRGSDPRLEPSRAQSGLCCGADLASLAARTAVQPSLQPSHKLGQVGDFDVQITDVDVPRNLRQIDVFHRRHGPGGGR